MARYATLKDYFQRVHLELIRSVISDYLISEQKDDRQIKNPVVQSLECVNDDAYFNVEVELGISADLMEKDCEEKSETLFFMITIAGNLKLKFDDIRVISVSKVNDNEFSEDNILSQFILPVLPVKELDRIGNDLYFRYKNSTEFKGLQLSLESLIKIAPIFFSDLPDDCLGRINMLESDIDIFYYNTKERRLKDEKRHARPGTILINKKKYYDERDGELLITVAHELIHRHFHQRFFMLPSLTEYVTNIRSELQSINDGTVVFRDSELIEKNRERKNALEENYKELLQCNGIENVSRKVVIIVTDIPGCIPEDYPAYYLSATDSMNIDDIRKVQKLSGEFDYSLIKFIIENTDVAGNLIQNATKKAKQIENEVGFEDESSSGIMILATAQFLKKLGMISNSNLESIVKWLKNDANCGAATSTSIINGFSCAISSAIKSGALNVTKQFGPPYYDSNGQTVFVARDDMSINLEDDTLKNIIMPQIKVTNKKNKVCRTLKEEGLLYGTKDNKRDLKVSFKSGLEKRLRVYSFSVELLDSECQEYVYDLNNSGYFFSPDSIPTGFFPVISNADGTKLAGIRISPDTDENLHTYSSGTTRSGKTFELVQQALFRAENGEKIIIFDHTGAFTEQELLKHQSKEIIDKFFSFWNLYTDGFPVDMLELRDCLSYKDKKERLVRMYAAGARVLGDYQEKILAAAVKSFLKIFSSGSEPNICDILDMICEDDKTDDAHEKLLYKLDSVLDDFHETPVTKSNWSEFLDTKNPIVVISTGYDSVGKGTQAIDMLLENLYAFKKRYPDKRYTVIIDEVQDQYLSEKGPINILLRKGGKHNLSMLLASQEFPDENTALGKVVGNCGTVKIFRPKQDNLKRVSQFTGVDQTVLNSLHQGECIVCGTFYNCHEGKNCISALKGKSAKYSSGLSDKVINDN